MLEKIKSLLFKNTSTRQTIAKNTFWLTVSNFGGRLVRAVIIIYAARVLGANGWGVFSYAITLIAFLTLFSDVGISPILNREISRTDDPAKRSRILSTSFFLKIFLLGICVLIVIFIAPRLSTVSGANAILPLISLVLIFDTLREFGFTICRALEKMEWDAGLFLLTNLAIVVFGFVFLYIAPTVKSFTYGYVVGTGIGAVAMFYVLRKNFAGLIKHFSGGLIKPILTSAWPFAIAGVLGMLLTNTDILLVGWMRSVEEVGFLSAVNRIIQLLYLVPSVLAVSLLPTFARLAGKDNAKMRRAMERAVSIILLAGIPLAIGGFILGVPIIKTIFGDAYAPGIAAFKILSLTLPLGFLGTILSYAIFAFDQQRKLIVFSTIGGVLNVVLDLLLIPPFGITGSAWATFGAMLASNSYLWWQMNKINSFQVFVQLKKIVFAAVVMGFASLLLLDLGINVFVIITTAGALYFSILYLLKEPVIDEVRFVLGQKNAPPSEERVSASP